MAVGSARRQRCRCQAPAPLRTLVDTTGVFLVGVFDLTGRRSVFSGIPDVAYVAAYGPLTVSSVDGGRFAVDRPGRATHPSFKVDASAVPVELRGAGQATRQINGLLAADVPVPTG